jgi:hypothetical protein
MTPQARAALERLTADLRDERAAHAAETTARAAAEAEVEKRKAALKVRCAAVKTYFNDDYFCHAERLSMC